MIATAGQSDGQVDQVATYSDWGMQSVWSAGWRAEEGFTGERQDPVTGLTRYYARTYQPTAGRFMSPDSYPGWLAAPQSLDRYAYVRNNPTSFTDFAGFMMRTDYVPRSTGATVRYAPNGGGGACHPWGCTKNRTPNYSAPRKIAPYKSSQSYTRFNSNGTIARQQTFGARSAGAAPRAPAASSRPSAVHLDWVQAAGQGAACGTQYAAGGSVCVTPQVADYWAKNPTQVTAIYATGLCLMPGVGLVACGGASLLDAGATLWETKQKTGTLGPMDWLSAAAAIGPLGKAGKAAGGVSKAAKGAGKAAKAGNAIPFGPAVEDAWKVLKRVDAKGAPLPGYKGGKAFLNDGSKGASVLPRTASDGSAITYREWDLSPKVDGVPRDARRLVTGSDGSAYYTTNHFESFVQFRLGE